MSAQPRSLSLWNTPTVAPTPGRAHRARPLEHRPPSGPARDPPRQEAPETPAATLQFPQRCPGFLAECVLNIDGHLSLGDCNERVLIGEIDIQRRGLDLTKDEIFTDACRNHV